MPRRRRRPGRGRPIAAVGTREQLRHREHTRHEHWSGATLLPGLINAHVHLVFDDTAPDPAALVERVRTTSDERLHEQAAGRALRALRSGTTTLRDCGDRDGITARLRDEIRTGATTGPRLITTGPPLTVPDGHCWFLGGSAGTDEELRERVRRNAELGVDMIKVMASGGQITPAPHRAGSPSSTATGCASSSPKPSGTGCRSPRTPTAPPRSATPWPRACAPSSTAPGRPGRVRCTATPRPPRRWPRAVCTRARPPPATGGGSSTRCPRRSPSRSTAGCRGWPNAASG
ncbi:hypothetical protein GCM10020366_70540 [Saccharopolyspora gregorii]|uniref:Amidohydrolase-related domain-containing protein n=1 Tax=Saccharopolyspora gregorii TaxID=33914 RepID=A0ABP6S2X3_9PSEU